MRAFEGYGFRGKVDTLIGEGRATCLSLTKEPYHVNENIDGWVCLLQISESSEQSSGHS